MQRTQVYFPEEVLEELRREAYERKTSLAEIIRRKIMKQTQKTKKSVVQKRLKAVEEISKINLKLPTDWQEVKKIILEMHNPFHEHQT